MYKRILIFLLSCIWVSGLRAQVRIQGTSIDTLAQLRVRQGTTRLEADDWSGRKGNWKGELNIRQVPGTFSEDSIPSQVEQDHVDSPVDSIILGRLIIVHTEDPDGHSTIRIYRDRSHRFRRSHTRQLGFDLGLLNYSDLSAYSGLAGVNPSTRVQDYSPAGLNTFAPAGSAGPVTAAQFSLIPLKSVQVDLWIFRNLREFGYGPFGLEYGFGLVMDNFRYRQPITYIDHFGTRVIQDSVSFRKNKLFAEYLSIPLLLHLKFPTRHGHPFHLSLGSEFAYLIEARTKQISSARGKVKQRDEFNLSRFRIDPELEAGFRTWALYLDYSLLPLHQYGVRQYAYSLGIRFRGF